MKKIYSFLAFLLTFTLSWGQATDLYFSMYIEGSSSNKALAIYNGTGADVDLGNYKVELYTNGSASANNTLEWTSGTILANGEVYVIANSSAVADILNRADTTSTVTYFNGDDAVALLKTDGTNWNVLDVIGEIGVDPGSGWAVAGVSNATKDHTLTRKTSVCGPNNGDWATSAGTDAQDSEWIVTAQNTGFTDLDTYSGCSSTTTPTLTISAPADNTTFNPETTSVDVEFVVTDFTLGTDGSVQYTINGGTAQTTTSSPITVSVSAGNTYTVVLELVDNNGDPLNPAVTDQVSFDVADYMQVADLSALRAGNIGDYYEVTGEVYVIGGEDYTSNTKIYVQDANAGIMIYDPSGIMPFSGYALYDGITGLKGRLAEYRGMMELIPTVDPGASSQGNVVTPVDVTVADFNTYHDTYESMLIKFTAVTIDTSGGNTVFNYATNYDVIQGSDTTTLRVAFHSLDGVTIPTGSVDLTAIGAEYSYSPSSPHPQVYPRDANDFETNQAVENQNIPGLQVYPNPATGDKLYITTDNGEETMVSVFDLSGKLIMQQTMDNNRSMSIANLRPGIYLLKIQQGDREQMIKLVRK